MMRLGIIASSGGSVFATGINLLKSCGYEVSAYVVTDRECGIERACDELGVSYTRIIDNDNVGFSCKASQWLFFENNVDWVCLFFTRLISSSIYSFKPCINIHPSLLPAFPGFNSLQRAFEKKVRFVGATAHFVDGSTDGGELVAQVVGSVVNMHDIQQLERLSFAQKLYIFLVLCESVFLDGVSYLYKSKDNLNTYPAHSWNSQSLRSKKLADAFEDFLKSEKIYWIR